MWSHLKGDLFSFSVNDGVDKECCNSESAKVNLNNLISCVFSSRFWVSNLCCAFKLYSHGSLGAHHTDLVFCELL